MRQERRWERTASSNNLFRNSPKPSQQLECLSRTGLCSGIVESHTVLHPLVLRCRYLPHPSPRAVAPVCHCCPVGMAGEGSLCWHVSEWRRTGSWLREDEVSCPYLPVSENRIFPFVKLLKRAGFLQLKPVVFPQPMSYMDRLMHLWYDLLLHHS